MERLRGEIYNVGIGNKMCLKLAVEDIGGGFADVGKIRNEARYGLECV